MPKTQEIPIGRDFLNLVWDLDDKVQQATDERFQDFGSQAPACLTALGTVLSRLDRLASCFDGCGGGDHVIEYLTGRVCSLARAAVRLLRFGYYDESLSLVRSIGEIANLMQLFKLSATDLEVWRTAPRPERIAKFGPASVRRRLESLGEPANLSRDWYAALCEIATHPTPETKPNAFNLLAMPVASPIIQDAGILVCLNELSVALVCFGLPVIGLSQLGEAERQQALVEIRTLGEGLGGVTLEQLPKMWAQLAQTFRESDETDEVSLGEGADGVGAPPAAA